MSMPPEITVEGENCKSRHGPRLPATAPNGADSGVRRAGSTTGKIRPPSSLDIF
jgi:hypothetical protein